MGLKRIVSGGQTGVDRAALDVALELGIACGGWCPRGRLAEDGVIPDRYPLAEAASPEYAPRTALNVRDSDGTLILTVGPPTGGTALTETMAREKDKPCLLVDLAGRPSADAARDWIRAGGIEVLNVAGPRESNSPGIYRQAAEFLRRLLSRGSR